MPRLHRYGFCHPCPCSISSLFSLSPNLFEVFVLPLIIFFIFSTITDFSNMPYPPQYTQHVQCAATSPPRPTHRSPLTYSQDGRQRPVQSPTRSVGPQRSAQRVRGVDVAPPTPPACTMTQLELSLAEARRQRLAVEEYYKKAAPTRRQPAPPSPPLRGPMVDTTRTTLSEPTLRGPMVDTAPPGMSEPPPPPPQRGPMISDAMSIPRIAPGLRIPDTSPCVVVEAPPTQPREPSPSPPPPPPAPQVVLQYVPVQYVPSQGEASTQTDPSIVSRDRSDVKTPHNGYSVTEEVSVEKIRLGLSALLGEFAIYPGAYTSNLRKAVLQVVDELSSARTRLAARDRQVSSLQAEIAHKDIRLRQMHNMLCRTPDPDEVQPNPSPKPNVTHIPGHWGQAPNDEPPKVTHIPGHWGQAPNEPRGGSETPPPPSTPPTPDGANDAAASPPEAPKVPAIEENVDKPEEPAGPVEEAESDPAKPPRKKGTGKKGKDGKGKPGKGKKRPRKGSPRGKGSPRSPRSPQSGE